MHTAHRTILIGFCLVALAPVAGYSQVSSGSAKPAAPSSAAEKQVAIIRDYASGLAGVHAANPEVKLRVDRDTAPRGELVLVVDYPAPNDNPASRDVRLDATNTNWSAGSAISFRVRPEHATRLSVSFLDRN